MVKAQKWLDREYPKENRSKVKEVYLNEPDLEGELDLREFTYYEVGAKVLISLAVNETKLNLKNLPKNTKIIRLIPVQEYLNKEYPTRQEREQVKALDVSDKNLEGSLDLSDFVSLKELNCQCNKLTSLNLTNCLQLEKVECSYNKLINLDISNCFPLTKLNCDDNLLTNLILPANLINLKELRLNDNNFPLQDLSFLREVTNLEILCLGNNMIINNGEKANRGIYNRFIGSLDYLSEMKRLEVLDIRNTDINEVDIAQLPKSLETIVYSIDKRPNCQLKTIISQLDKVKHGFCQECCQPNTCHQINSTIGSNWCQPCMSRHFQEEFKNWTSNNPEIDKFIRNYQLRVVNCREVLEWIPYEKFENVEYLARGGFGLVYKADWTDETIKGWNIKENKWRRHEISKWVIPKENTPVVLKILNNSRDIKKDFLQEITNYKLFNPLFTSKGVPRIVQCYGISQDPKTKNYIMVIAYIAGGNLRQFSHKNDSGLDFFRCRLSQLKDIAQGLTEINNQGLVHKDFHSGNILKSNQFCLITDLGLCRPADEKDSSKVYGVLPYVAPEVLQGKPYTQKSDIYSFGIVAYELFANASPYLDKNYDAFLALDVVCNGLRPNLEKLKIPQLLKDLIERCWNAKPERRPSTEELNTTIDSWCWAIIYYPSKYVQTLFYQQYLEIKDEYDNFSQNLAYKSHPTAIMTSKLINTRQISELLREHAASKDLELSLFRSNEMTDQGLWEQSPLQVQIQIKQNQIISLPETSEKIEPQTISSVALEINKSIDGQNCSLQQTGRSSSIFYYPARTTHAF